MKMRGFTLIELVIVLVLLSILVAVAVPKYQNLSTSATTAAQRGIANAVKSAWSIYVASNSGALPTNASLITALSTLSNGTNPGCRATTAGNVTCILGNNTTYVISTYTDTACSTTSTTATQTITCVGQ